MKASLRKALGSLIILTILLVLFQNCGPAKVSTGQESKTLASTAPYATPTPATTPTPVINISSTPTPTPPPLPTVTPTPVATPTATPVATPTPTPPPPTPTPLMITSQPVASNIQMDSVTISWSLNMYATGLVEYGTTTAYGLKSTPELSFNYNYHIQSLGGLSAGTTYHFHVVSTSQTGQTVYSADSTFTTVAPTPTPTPPPPSPTPAVSMLKTSGGYCLERSQQMDTYNAFMLVQAPCNSSAVQYFAKTTISTNVFNVTSSASGECINVPSNLTAEGTIIDFWPCYTGYTGMQWKFQDNGNGTFKMIDSHSLRCLTYNNYSTTTSQQLFISTCQAGNANQDYHY